MRFVALFALLLVGVSGCASNPAGETPERDEAAYLEGARAYGTEVTENVSDEDLLSVGDDLCNLAETEGRGIDAAADGVADGLIAGGASAATVKHFAAVSAAAQVFLCPELS